MNLGIFLCILGYFNKHINLAGFSTWKDPLDGYANCFLFVEIKLADILGTPSCRFGVEQTEYFRTPRQLLSLTSSLGFVSVSSDIITLTCVFTCILTYTLHAYCIGAWWLISRFCTFRLKGHGFESRSSHHVGTLGKSFTRSYLWHGRACLTLGVLMGKVYRFRNPCP